MEIRCWAVMRGSLTFPLGLKMIDLFSSYSRLVWNKHRHQWFEQSKSTFIYTAIDLWDSILYFSLSLSYTGVHVYMWVYLVPAQPVKHWSVGFGHIVEEQVQLECVRGCFPDETRERGIVTVKTQTWNPYLPSAAIFCLIKLPVNQLGCRNH